MPPLSCEPVGHDGLSAVFVFVQRALSSADLSWLLSGPTSCPTKKDFNASATFAQNPPQKLIIELSMVASTTALAVSTLV